MADFDEAAPRIKRRRTEEPGPSDRRSSTSSTRSYPVRLRPIGFLSKNATSEELHQTVAAAQCSIQSTIRELDYALTEDLKQTLQAIIDVSLDVSVKIGFSGPSGAGKSSLANALADEDDILPRGGLGQACTPVVTELAYNHINDKKYRALIEYISRDELSEDIRLALHAINQVPEDENDENLHGPVQKIETLYPNFKSDMRDMTADEILSSSPDILELVGTTLIIEEDTRKAFEAKFRPKIIPRIGERRSESEHWPLVQKVRVFLKSDFLKNGPILVDIPGTSDSHRARGGRAREYIQQCSAFCIVGESLRFGSNQQIADHLDEILHFLQYANCLDLVVLVSTKNDIFPDNAFKDIKDPRLAALAESRHQTQSSLDLARDQHHTWSCTANDLNTDLQNVKKELRKWRGRRNKLLRGDEVCYPSTRVQKKLVKGEPITVKEAESQIRELEFREKPLPSQVKDARLRATAEQLTIAKVERELRGIDVEYRRLQLVWIKENSRRLLKKLFANKIRQLNQELQAEAILEQTQFIPLDEGIDPPFFPVSSSKYMKLNGLLKDGIPATEEIFTSLEDTGVPELREHLKTVYKNARHERLWSIYKQTETALITLKIWLWRDAKLRQVDQDEASVAVKQAFGYLKKITPFFAEPVEMARSAVSDHYSEHFRRNISLLAMHSKQSLVNAMLKWTYKKEANPRGAMAQEYKAIVTKRGEHHGKRRAWNFNILVEKLIEKSLTQVWKALLAGEGGLMQQALAHLGQGLQGVLDNVHDSVRAYAVIAGVQESALRNLDRQLSNRKHRLQEIIRNCKREIGTVHTGASAKMANTIKHAWGKGYETASEASGKDALMNMNDAMRERACKDEITLTAIKLLDKQVHDKLTDIMNQVQCDVTTVAHGLLRDYGNALHKRDKHVMVAADDKINEARNRLIRLGFGDVEAADEETGETDKFDEEDPKAMFVGQRKVKHKDETDAEREDETTDGEAGFV